VTIAFADSSGNPVVPDITGVFQDEPTGVKGSGNFCPDARLQKDGGIQVRRERTGVPQIPGDGRVYHINFTVDLGAGPCEGEVTVCVPHDQGAHKDCIDEGPLYDSFTCTLKPNGKKPTAIKPNADKPKDKGANKPKGNGTSKNKGKGKNK
jgi:hypothetical protein